MTQVLKESRYFWRELLPRFVLITALFKVLLPLIPFHLFQFAGGWVAAAVYAWSFTALFSFIGAYVFGLPSVQSFMEASAKRWWFIPGNVCFVIGLPALALVAVAAVSPAVFTMGGLFAPFVGSIILNLACAATHDWS